MIIKRDGNDITDPQDNPQSVKVGEMINLSAELDNAPDGAVITSQWSIPGTTYKSWSATQTKTTIKDTDIDTKDTSFYWVDAGTDRQLSYTATLNGKTLPTVKADFNVTSPKPHGRVDLSASASINYDSKIKANVFGFGNPAIANQNGKLLQKKHSGFTLYNVSTSDPQGSITFVQVVDPTTRRKLVDDGTPDGKWIQLSPQSGGDKCPWTPITTDTEPYNVLGPNLGLHTEDNPGQPIAGDAGRPLKELTIQDSFTMWIMYKPNTPNAAWVPLMSIDWGWKGSIKLVGGQWETGSIPFGLSGPTFTKSNVSYPKWTNGIHDNVSWN